MYVYIYIVGVVMTTIGSIKVLSKESPLVYFKFINNILPRINELYELFNLNADSDLFENKSALKLASNIWDEFINEPGTALELSLLQRSRSASAYALHNLYVYMSKHLLRPSQGEFVLDQKAIHSILQCLMSVFNDPKFISKLDSTRRNQQKTRDSLYGYVTDLKKIYAKLMVVRVDFAYNRFVCNTMLPLEHIENDWDQLLLYVKTNFFNSFAGYGVKFERGDDKGLHAHSVFFFDGNVVCNDAKIGRILGEYWEQQVTEGLGVHFNCNTSDHKVKLKVCGLGTFTGRETAFWEGAWIIADYLSKPDVMVRLMLPERTKIFRRGSLSEKQKIKLESVLRKQAMLTSHSSDDTNFLQPSV